MRAVAFLTLGAILASCSTAPEPTTRSADKQRAYESLLAGKVAGVPISCLPEHNANDMTVIDGQTVAFRLGQGTTYIMHLGEGCSMLGGPNYALLSKQVGGMGLCHGDIVQVFDTNSHFTVGSCVIGDITPYRLAQ